MSRYVLLCATLCLATATLSLVTGAVLARASWTLLRRTRLQRSVLRHASFLFFIRTLPLSVPVVVVFCAVLPSFLRFEPEQTGEQPEQWLVAVAVCSVVGAGVFAIKLATTFLKTWQQERDWLHSSRRIDIPAAIPIYELQRPDSLVAVVGVLSPRMFIGRRILDCLTPEELHAAIAHEMAHVRSLDNLKQALLSATGIASLLTPLDRAFRSATEICADAQALRCKMSPLDLGGAIVKVARLKTNPPSIAASHLLPEFESSALRIRVEYLHAALEGDWSLQRVGKYGWLVVAGLVAVYLIKLQLWLMLTHRMTELLVR